MTLAVRTPHRSRHPRAPVRVGVWGRATLLRHREDVFGDRGCVGVLPAVDVSHDPTPRCATDTTHQTAPDEGSQGGYTSRLPRTAGDGAPLPDPIWRWLHVGPPHSRRHRFQVCDQLTADVFGDRRNDGVARYSEAVHLEGNPINQSVHSGFTSKPLIRCPPARRYIQAR